MIETYIVSHDRDGRTSGGSQWAFLTVDEVSERAADGALGLWAVGATEQHGPHLVTGFDHLAAGAIVERVADRLGQRAVVLPPLQYGCSDYWLQLGGTLSLTAPTMRAVLLDVCRSAAHAGLRHLLIVNGHSGNLGPGITSVAELGDVGLGVEFVCYWDLVDRQRLATIQDVEQGFGHAGEMETSVGLQLAALARPDRIPAPDGRLDPHAPGGYEVVFHRAPRPGSDSRDGVIGAAAAGSAAVGEAVLEMAVDGLVDHCERLLASTPASGATR